MNESCIQHKDEATKKIKLGAEMLEAKNSTVAKSQNDELQRKINSDTKELSR
jgi:hypothetical protein